MSAQRRVGLKHRLGIDEFQRDGSLGSVDGCPDLAVAAGAGRKHGTELITLAVNRDLFATLHGTSSRLGCS